MPPPPGCAIFWEMNVAASENLPDAHGRFGPYGGRYVPETLIYPLQQLEEEYFRAQHDPKYQEELYYYLRQFCGRPTPLYFAERLTRHLGGPKIYLKREDLLHTGAHKINNALGQVLLARRMGKTRIIAETGAGQHGVATATVAAMFGLECVIYMGDVDCKRQELNVYRMKMLGANVVPVTAGQKTLKEAVNEAMRDWVTNVRGTHYILGTAYGAHPYPVMVRNFQRIIGDEARRQILEQGGTAAGFARRLRRRRLQRHRPVLPVSRRRIGQNARCRSRRRGNHFLKNTPRVFKAARWVCCRGEIVYFAGRGGTNPAHPQRLGRPGLRGRRA